MNAAGSSAAGSSAAAFVSPNGPAAPTAVNAAQPPPQRLPADVSTVSRLPANGKFTTPPPNLRKHDPAQVPVGHPVYAGHVVLSFTAAHDCAVRPQVKAPQENISAKRLTALISVVSSGTCFCEEWEDLELREPSYSRPSPSPSPSPYI